MKKTLILILISSISTNIFAQLKAGIKFSPTLALNNVINTAGANANESYANNSLGIRYSTGLNLDFHFGNTVAFGTGLWFSVKRAGFMINYPSLGSSVDEVYNLQYLQIPLTLKMYTNNIADDMKLYFQLGPSLDIKINEKLITDGDPLLKPLQYAAIKDDNSAVFSYLDISIIGGAGVEWQMGENTALFGGLSYNRGLLNTFNPTLKWSRGSYVDADITNKTSAISLDLGIKF